MLVLLQLTETFLCVGLVVHLVSNPFDPDINISLQLTRYSLATPESDTHSAALSLKSMVSIKWVRGCW